MIPKKIHYCWFGHNPKPKMAEKCIKSWKKFCKDYEIIEWNEDNFDISACPLYVRQAYEAKKWAFVTDYARLKILYENGGIYFDTDVEIIKNIDELLEHDCFMGIERPQIGNPNNINTGLGLGCVSEFTLIKEIMDDYNDRSFINEDGSHNITTCTVLNTEVLKKHGYINENKFQMVAGAAIYPSEYFSPMDMDNGKMYITRNTYTIHHYGLSWTTDEHRKERLRYLKKAKRADFVYNIKVMPNTILKKILGEQRYKNLKNKFKKGDK